MLSIQRGRLIIGGLVALAICAIGISMRVRALRGDPLFDPTGVIIWVGVLLNLTLQAESRPQALTREIVKPLGSGEHAWTDVRRVFFRRGYLVFDFGGSWWNRPWLILPQDPYDRARALLILDRALPAERVVHQDLWP